MVRRIWTISKKKIILIKKIKFFYIFVKYRVMEINYLKLFNF